MHFRPYISLDIRLIDAKQPQGHDAIFSDTCPGAGLYSQRVGLKRSTLPCCEKLRFASKFFTE